MKTKLSFQALLDKTKRTQYVDKDVVASVEPCEPQEIEFFTLGKYISDNELEVEVSKLGFELAHPYALALYAKEHPEFADEKSTGTHWQNAKGNWCFATFFRWIDERRVDVYRGDGDDWNDRWWFAGVRKSSPKPLETKPSSVPLTLALPNWKYTHDYQGEYIRISEEVVTETIELRTGLSLDMHEGKIVGVEIIKIME